MTFLNSVTIAHNPWQFSHFRHEFEGMSPRPKIYWHFIDFVTIRPTMTFQHICHRNCHSPFWHIFINYGTKFYILKNRRWQELNLQPPRQEYCAIPIKLLVILQISIGTNHIYTSFFLIQCKARSRPQSSAYITHRNRVIIKKSQQPVLPTATALI